MREKQAAASDVKTKTDGTQLTVAGQHVQQSATHSHLQMSIYRVTQKNGNIWKTQQKFKKSKRKKLLTETEPLQLAF